MDEGYPAHRRTDACNHLWTNRLRTARRISHVFIMDAPTYPEPLFVTDGVGTPRVAILSAVETVTDAAQLGPLRDRRFALGDRQQRDRGAGALTGSRQAT